MPELPDVEIFKKYFHKKALKHLIHNIRVFTQKILRNVSSQQLQKALKGETCLSLTRHGKALFVELSNGTFLCLHFGMTGFLYFFNETNPYARHTRYEIEFDHGTLAYVDVRILGSLSLTNSFTDYIQEKGLGPDALSITFEEIKDIFSSRGKIKPTLMDQSKVAGIGNVYCDEILFHAKIHPLRSNRSLTEEELKRLHQKITEVLKGAISAKADVENMPKSWLLPVRKLNQVCPSCHEPLKRVALQGRGTYFCQACQAS